MVEAALFLPSTGALRKLFPASKITQNYVIISLIYSGKFPSPSHLLIYSARTRQ